MKKGFVDLNEAVKGVLIDAKYAGYDNFIGRPVTGYNASKVVGSIELAQALCIARDIAVNMNLKLLLYDAYRPAKAVQDFMNWCAAEEDNKTKAHHYPNHDKTELVPLGYISAHSGHSRAGTIDLTLCTESGIPLDMGGWFDLMDIRSHHGYSGCTQEQTKNRLLLKTIMEQSGFGSYKNEWWHYRLSNEPYPDTYFDFDID